MKNLINLVRKGAALWGGAIILAMPCTGPVLASQESDAVLLLAGADVMILGEVHDNADHHQMQADLLTALAPKAVVWEMITQTQAETLDPKVLSDADQLSVQLDWANSGWPDFALYAPVFAAAQGAQQFGGQVPRSVAGAVMANQNGVVAYFGEDAAIFGLDLALGKAEQQTREADQMANHCNAMPAEMLPLLVEFQRLRDAALAKAVTQALQATGGPVAVITGNGHARRDRGVPVYLAKAHPGISVVTLGQSEGGQIEGDFDLVLDAIPVDRPDPCLAFQ